MIRIAFSVVFVLALSACGGGGGNPGTCSGSAQYCAGNTGTGTGTGTNTGVDTSIAANVAGQCAAPRSASKINPLTDKLYGDVQGSLSTEKSWIKAFVNETYLWYQDVPSVDASKYVLGATVPYIYPSNNGVTSVVLSSNFEVADAYFNSQRSLQTTASGKPKDQFHFTYQTDEWVALSTAGTSVGFGFQVALLEASPPRVALVAYTDPGTPAAAAGLARGAKFLTVNGADVSSGDADVLNEGLFSPVAGKSYTFRVLDQGSSLTRTVVMTPAVVTSTPVQNVKTLPAPYTSVGYIQFNDHIGTSENQLITAVNQLKAANGGSGITDLVLDLRYNGGGLLDIASEMAYMIAGPSNTEGKFFEKSAFNDKNPFGFSEADKTTPFHKTAQGFSTPLGQALPNLGLTRVFVLTGAGTCSASEAIMNGLKGAGIEVIQIGGTTCGKPYGFYPQDNCSVTYFTVQFKGVNNAGFGDYADGFVPGGTGSAANNMRGCAVADDFSKQLGDVTEGRLAAALRYRSSGSCGGATSSASSSSQAFKALAAAAPEPLLGRSAVRENRLYRPKSAF
ncbi:MAG: S41 family peptidase [Pseudomonadota bacterium]